MPALRLQVDDEAVRVLMVGGAEADRAHLRSILVRTNWHFHEVKDCGQALRFLSEFPLGVVLSEPVLPDGDWRALQDRLAGLGMPPRLIVVSRTADEQFWTEMLNSGGYDILPMPFDRMEVIRVISLAWLDWRRSLRNGQDAQKAMRAAS